MRPRFERGVFHGVCGEHHKLRGVPSRTRTSKTGTPLHALQNSSETSCSCSVETYQRFSPPPLAWLKATMKASRHRLPPERAAAATHHGSPKEGGHLECARLCNTHPFLYMHHGRARENEKYKMCVVSIPAEPIPTSWYVQGGNSFLLCWITSSGVGVDRLSPVRTALSDIHLILEFETRTGRTYAWSGRWTF